MKLVSMILAFGISGVALGQDESEVVSGSSDSSTFRYGWSTETTENASGDESTERWVSIRSGHVTGGINSDLDKYRLRVNSNGGELLGMQNTEIGKSFLNRFQVEAGASSTSAPYGLLALELPVIKPITFFMGSVHNPGGAQRFIVGPIMYYSNSNSLLFAMPKGTKSESDVDMTYVFRNRIREFKSIWLDADLTYKQVAAGGDVDGFSPYGYSAAIGVWKMYAKYAIAPYYEGTKRQKTTYEVGVDASF